MAQRNEIESPLQYIMHERDDSSWNCNPTWQDIVPTFCVSNKFDVQKSHDSLQYYLYVLFLIVVISLCISQILFEQERCKAHFAL